ncbi:hypothetical protein P7C70_g5809, partial [Phenoliferia sp. Uapishka_3]
MGQDSSAHRVSEQVTFSSSTSPLPLPPFSPLSMDFEPVSAEEETSRVESLVSPTPKRKVTNRDTAESFSDVERLQPPRFQPPARSLPRRPGSSSSSDDPDESLPDPLSFQHRNRSGTFCPPTPSSPPRSFTPSRRARDQAEAVSAAAEAGLARRLQEQNNNSARSERSGSRAGSSGVLVPSLGSSAPRPSQSSDSAYSAHLPSIEQSRINGVTALPNSYVMRDIEFSVMKLVSEKVFHDLMNEPLARHRFREFLESTEAGTTAFDSWLDLRGFKAESNELRIGSLALTDLYLSDSTSSQLPIPESMKDRLLEAFSVIAKIDTSLDAPARHLLASIYHTSFQSYLRYKLVETASAGGLSFLVSSEDDNARPPPGSSSAFSPSMQAYKAALRSENDPTSAARSLSGSMRRAAGSVEDVGFSKSSRMFVAPEAPELPEEGIAKVARFLGLKQRRTPKKPVNGEMGDFQAILGAEGVLDKKGGAVESQIEVFKDVYTKASAPTLLSLPGIDFTTMQVLVFRTEQRRIIFVTEPFLRFSGLPHTSPLDLYSSKILHKDFFELIVGSERHETSQLKKTLKIVINSGSSYSTPCGVRSQARSLVSGKMKDIVKQGTLHLTPLKDQEGSNEAFVAIFS